MRNKAYSENLDFKKADFIENFYKILKSKNQSAIKENQKNISLMKKYISYGLEEGECIELFVSNGMNRNIADSYFKLAKEQNFDEQHNLKKYSFKFETEDQEIFNSFDIKKIIKASSYDEACDLAEKFLENSEDFSNCKLITVSLID